MLVSTIHGDIEDSLLEPGVLVSTVRGPMDFALLERRDHTLDNDDEITQSIEFYFDGELMQRSVHVTLKKWPAGMEGTAKALFG